MRRVFLLLLLAALAGAAFWWFNRPQPIPVTLVEVGHGKVEASVSNTRAGSVEACQRTRLSPISGGRIIYLGVKKGDKVKKGQVLLRLWNDDQQAQSNVARTQVESARARVNEACALADNAEREAARMAKLRERGFISAGAEEKARFEAQSRRASCAAVRADVAQARARLTLTRVEQGRTIMVAPFDGTVADIVGELGEYTTPSPPGVATPPAIDLIDDSCLYITAPMDEVDAPKIRAGMTARVTLDALPGRVLTAHVRRVAPYVVAVEKQSRTVDVEADLDQPPGPGELLVGYSADLEVILDVRDNVLRVPTSAVLEGNRVLLYRPDTGKLEARTIKTGVTNWEYSEVLEGLQKGDRIAASLEREGVEAGALVNPEHTSASQ
jgi:HlyD family secretion protein